MGAVSPLVKLGYVTNGFRDHALEDALCILAELGYSGVGITLDVGHLDPYRTGREEVQRTRDLLLRLGLAAVIETGGRYVLDPRRKHWPSLLSSEGRKRRIDFLLRGLEIGEALGARVLSLWSGAPEPAVSREESWRRLAEGLAVVEQAARQRGMALGFEPEPGMLVASLEDYRELRRRIPASRAPALKLTLDSGHLQCTEEPPHARWVREFGGELVNFHLDDARGRVHEHLPLGEGEIDFPPLLEALVEVRYPGLALVELSRHSHAAPEAAARSMEFLRKSLTSPSAPRRPA